MNAYIIFTVIFGILAAALLITVISRAAKHKRFLPVGLLCVLGIIITGCAAAFFGYVSVYRRALPNAEKALESGGSVTVTQIPEGWEFDGAGTEDAVIFFQGGKVDAPAYAPLLRELALRGTDCYLIDAPFNIPFLGVKDADSIIERGKHERYYIAGHSLGGVTASTFCGSFGDKCSGLIMLAAYSASDIDDDIPVLSLYGSNDGLLDPESYDKARGRIQGEFVEYVIEGGNHAQFGSYGEQEGDSPADISPEEQLSFTVDKICEFIEAHRN